MQLHASCFVVQLRELKDVRDGLGMTYSWRSSRIRHPTFLCGWIYGARVPLPAIFLQFFLVITIDRSEMTLGHPNSDPTKRTRDCSRVAKSLAVIITPAAIRPSAAMARKASAGQTR